MAEMIATKSDGNSEQSDGEFWVESIVSSESHKGLVNFHWGEKRAQMDIETARKIAFDILECCESALSDQICYGFGEMMNDVPAGIALIEYFRDQREKWLEKHPRI